MALTQEQRQRICDAIQAMETQTAGEILCVVARASSDYDHVTILWAAFAALAAPWLVFPFGGWRVQTILSLQIVIFILIALVLSWPRLRLALIPRRTKRARAFHAANEQFYARGVAHTPNRAGVMIYVSIAERYARILVDDAIAAKVGAQEWRIIVNYLTDEIKRGRLTEGLISAVERIGAILALHLPPDGSGDLLPNRVYQI